MTGNVEGDGINDGPAELFLSTARAKARETIRAMPRQEKLRLMIDANSSIEWAMVEEYMWRSVSANHD